METKHRHGKECVLGTGHGRMPSFHKPVNERSSMASVQRTPADREEVWPFRGVFEAWRGTAKPACLAEHSHAGIAGLDADPKVFARAVQTPMSRHGAAVPSHVLGREEHRMHKQDPGDYEVVIEGGGVAGFRGALTLVRARRSVFVKAREPRAGGAVEDGVVR